MDKEATAFHKGCASLCRKSIYVFTAGSKERLEIRLRMHLKAFSVQSIESEWANRICW